MSLRKNTIIIRMNQLRAEMSKLEAELNMAPSLLVAPDTSQNHPFGTISTSNNNTFMGVQKSGWANMPTTHSFNMFQTKEMAENYAQAFNTLLGLRHMEGTLPPSGEKQYVIMYEWNHSDQVADIKVKTRLGKDHKRNYLSPTFGSEEEARAAIRTLGHAKLLHMFETFSHKEPK